ALAAQGRAVCAGAVERQAGRGGGGGVVRAGAEGHDEGGERREGLREAGGDDGGWHLRRAGAARHQDQGRAEGQEVRGGARLRHPDVPGLRREEALRRRGHEEEAGRNPGGDEAAGRRPRRPRELGGDVRLYRRRDGEQRGQDLVGRDEGGREGQGDAEAEGRR